MKEHRKGSRTGRARSTIAAGLGLVLWVPGSLAADFERTLEFRILYDGQPSVVSVPTGPDSEVVSGSFQGLVAAEGGGDLGAARASCHFVGRVFQDRSFSCGFTRTERLQGYCVFQDPEGDTAVAEWTCGTGATMTSDARCEGVAEFVSGTGPYGGLAGKVRFHADQLNGGEGFAQWSGAWNLPVYALHR